MSLILLGAAAVGAYFVTKKYQSGGVVSGTTRLYNLPDVEPDKQGGNYKRDFDIYFEAAADEFGVPFALIKAHAFRESSLNPKAFRDENPSKRTDRIGWASRGLMQLLFQPYEDPKANPKNISARFEKYGFSRYSNPDELFNPSTNVRIAAQLIRDNLNACNGNVRDAVNMYNTGVKYSTRQAPHNYTENVLQTYSTLVGREIT